MTIYAKHVSTRETPQSEPIPGTVPNSAGGHAFAVDDWTRLNRFLILGAEGGSYYATEQKLTVENAEPIKRCIAMDGLRTVRTIVEISHAGRAPKNDPAVFALAMCAGLGNAATKQAAYEALPAVCRIGTHIFQFAESIENFRGWGRGLRRGIAGWYSGQDPQAMAFQVVKYQQRNGWAHRDLLRLAHPNPDNESRKAIYHWIVKGWESVGEDAHPDLALRIIWAFEKAKRSTSAAEVAKLIREFQLPRECVPTQWLNDAEVWAALLEKMPLTAMIRNLGKMTAMKLIAPMSDAAGLVRSRLADADYLRKARVHPIGLLTALKTYQAGRGVRSRARENALSWSPVAQVVDALDAAFYLAFRAIEPTGKRWLLAVDVSGSMDGGRIAGVPGLTPRIGAAAMTLVTAAVEPLHYILGFAAGNRPSKWTPSHGLGTGLVPLAISPRQRLDDVCKTMAAVPMGGTDCALPMVHALEQNIAVDVFVVYTDSETWAGDIHPVQALRQYRERTGIPAKLIVCGMVSNGFSIADPNDAGMMDVVGFDASAPAVMADFARDATAMAG